MTDSPEGYPIVKRGSVVSFAELATPLPARTTVPFQFAVRDAVPVAVPAAAFAITKMLTAPGAPVAVEAKKKPETKVVAAPQKQSRFKGILRGKKCR